MAQKTVVTVISKMSERPAGREACLVVIYGDELGRKFSLDQGTINVGRSSRADIQIDQDSVSRHHAKIDHTSGLFVLTDLGSTNGTYVNDSLIDEHSLRDGDFIKIGRTIFKFLSGSNIENAYHEEIYRLTTTDGLTQIYNKRYFLEVLDRELSRAKRYHRPLSLLLADIDHFKAINDAHGHLTGDYVLKQLANSVRAKLRREDVFARYGGEEFALILPETDLEHARLLADKVRKLVEQTEFLFEGAQIKVTVSVGAAALDEEEDAAALIRRADERLYEAKNGGRNSVCG